MVQKIFTLTLTTVFCIAGLGLADEKYDQIPQVVGAGGLSFGVLRLDTSPLEELAARDTLLKNKTFDFEDRNAIQLGLLGYGGPPHTARIGFGGWVAYKQFQSKPFRHANAPDSVSDSISTLHVIIPHAGFLADKAFQMGELNLHVGGLVGGGVYVVINDTYAAQNGSAFRNYESDTTSYEKSNDDQLPVAAAPCWMFDVHTGVTYSILPWLHVGADASLIWMYSSVGFGYGYGSFWANNSSFRFRLMFGNAG